MESTNRQQTLDKTDDLAGCGDFNAPLDQATSGNRDWFAHCFSAVRKRTEQLSAPLSAEDQQLQSMPDASPAKWHRAHTTWYFETFILEKFEQSFAPFDLEYRRLFNSYYFAIGEQHPRADRGLLSRPDANDVSQYRQAVEQRLIDILYSVPDSQWPDFRERLLVGLNHEQQHQELLLTDILHAFSMAPSPQAYQSEKPVALDLPANEFIAVKPGIQRIGAGQNGYSFDNERPQHRVFLEPYEIATRPVSNGEYLAFIEDGGYEQPLLWLSDGWAWKSQANATTPLYWRRCDQGYQQVSLSGLIPLDPDAPVSSVNYYEAAAYALWSGARLPSEAEWEHAIGTALFASQDNNRAAPAGNVTSLFPHWVSTADSRYTHANVWEWTNSAYLPYPGFKPAAAELAEYNGKFMVNQMVLRGRSFATAAHHSRTSYRNFFYPDACWQFSGIRLARDS